MRKRINEKVEKKQAEFVARKSAADKKERVDVIDAPFNVAKYLQGAKTGAWRDAQLEKKAFFAVNKTLSEGVGTAGGFLVPPEYNQQLVELLKARAVVRSLSPMVLNITSDTVIVPRMTGAATAHWVEEDESKTASDQTFGQIKMVLKEVAAVTRVSNNLLADSSPAVDAVIRKDLVEQLQLAEDLAFLRGTGGAQPMGLSNLPQVGSVILGTPNGASPNVDNLKDAQYAIDVNNGTYTAWIMHPRTKTTVSKLKDANGQYIWSDAKARTGDPDMLCGLPVKLTTQIPINITCGTNTDCSQIFLGAWPEFIIAQKVGSTIELSLSEHEGDSFIKDRTAIRATLRMDGAPRQPNCFYVINGVRP